MGNTVFILKQAAALGVVISLAGLMVISRDNSFGYRAVLEEYRFKLPFLASVGVYIYARIPWNFDSYNRKIRAKIADLYGQRRVDAFFTVHMAQKIALVMAVAFVFIIVSLLGQVDRSFYFFAVLIIVLLYYQTDAQLDKKLKQKKRDILIDLAGFINTLALMINAGLPFSGAVRKVVMESDRERPLYKELNLMLSEISAGKSTVRAYEDMAFRCKVPEVTRFVSAVLQNLNRGNRDLVYVLRTLSQEAWDKRKDLARKQGEEASTKLVFPMVMVFVAIAIIVLAPAMQSMGR
ncbi:type II secretion system F family protein [Phosphitispora sp. TUW77]|uniref:type II secretion system F family protein n=1 Tax=Phosphitispora sp. TUW77 TaxID=3152361 RepID=UPI003AB467DB